MARNIDKINKKTIHTLLKSLYSDEKYAKGRKLSLDNYEELFEVFLQDCGEMGEKVSNGMVSKDMIMDTLSKDLEQTVNYLKEALRQKNELPDNH